MSAHDLTVDLGDRSYPIAIGSGMLSAGSHLADALAGSQCLVVSNVTVAPLYFEKLKPGLGDAAVDLIELPDGEAHKTVSTVQSILDRLVECKAGRDVTIVALGGGVVGDVAGFAAACYMRGVAFVQVPTTLLAQVDSSVGGKTGVNHPGGKNLIGAFHQPRSVIIDTDTLSTLPDREFRAGLAEVIKYGAIADTEFLGWLEDNMATLLERDPEALARAIRRSCEIKAEVVAEDEREAGKRALLNFGHTFGHAIENTVGYGEWLHGEAVAAGMLMAAAMSDIEDAERQRLTRLVEAAGLPVDPPAAGAANLREAMKLDKKVQSNTIRLVLLRRLGDAFVTADYDDAALDRVLEPTGA
ncbi:MAG: 3-dehydroquinate synthase [Woeseiaceae bacterium]|jgi:3-dehydroquinate synthase|nr:3-dehydroquinate synthase [Woeseiaceae bacterium]